MILLGEHLRVINMAGYFKTIEDLERATYGVSGSDQLLKATTGIHAVTMAHKH